MAVQQEQGAGQGPPQVEVNGFFEDAPALAAVAGLDGYLKELGGPWTRITGWPRSELTARPFVEFVHPDDVEATLAELEHLGEGHETIAFVNRYRRPDGTWVHLQWYARTIADGRIHAIAWDVSDAIARDRALARQQELLRTIADFQAAALSGRTTGDVLTAALVAVLRLVDAESGSVGLFGAGAAGGTVVTCLAAIGPDAVCRPGEQQPVLDDLTVDLDAPGARATTREVVSGIARDGRVRRVQVLVPVEPASERHLLAMPLVGAETDGVLGIFRGRPFTDEEIEFLRPFVGAVAAVVARDRSIRSRTEMTAEVSRLSSLVATMLERSEFVVVTCDVEERVTFLSPAAQRLLGNNLAADESWAVSRLLASPTQPDHDLAATFSSPTGEVREVEWLLIGHDGHGVPVAVTGSPTFGPEGEPAGWVLICTPVAERRRAEVERIERAGLAVQVEILRSRALQLAALADTTQYVVASHTHREALDVIEHFLPTAFVAHESRLLRVVGADRLSDAARPPNSVLAAECWAVRTGRTYRSEAGRGVRCAHLPEAGRHLCTPIGDGRHVTGIITVELGGPVDDVDDVATTTMLEDVARQLSTAMTNLRLRRALEEQASIDPLTRVGNRRAADEALGSALSRKRSTDADFAVIMLDIDHFKDINDAHGHDVGDEVLTAFASLLHGLIREDDRVARLGGEEFLVVLRDLDRTDLDRVVESIRRGIERHTFPRGVTTTASMGAVHVTSSRCAGDQLLSRADELLYEAKRLGRNRALVAEWDDTPTTRGSGRVAPQEIER